MAARGAPVAAQAAREGGEETGHDLLREKVGFTKKTARRHRRVGGRAVGQPGETQGGGGKRMLMMPHSELREEA